jgi:hypothetical protein
MFDKADRCLSRRIAENRARKQGQLSVDASGLVITRETERRRIAWSAVSEIVALRKPAFLGDNLGLRIRCDDGTALEILEFDPAWPTLLDGLRNHVAGALPYAQWSLRTAFTEPTGVVQVYLRQ